MNLIGDSSKVSVRKIHLKQNNTTKNIFFDSCLNLNHVVNYRAEYYEVLYHFPA